MLLQQGSKVLFMADEFLTDWGLTVTLTLVSMPL